MLTLPDRLRWCNMTHFLGLLLGLSLLGLPRAYGAQAETPIPGFPDAGDSLTPGRIGLALSGGAALGLAHIGVIKVLEAESIPICYVSGNSLGSIVGGVYACGYSGVQMESIARTIDWDHLFDDQVPANALNLEERENRSRYVLSLPHRNFVPQLPSGMIAAQNVYVRFKELTERANFNARGDFDSLVLPYRAIAVDYETEERLVFRRGNLADAMRASMAIPGVFTPANEDGRVLVDGGVVQLLPVDPLLEFKPDFIIAVTTRQPRLGTRIASPIDLAYESFFIATGRDHEEQTALADVVIKLDLHGLSASDFNRAEEFIKRGEQAARAALPEIRKKLAGRRLIRQRHEIAVRPMPIVRTIELKGLKITNRPVLLREIRTRANQRLDLERLIQDLRRIHNTGLFSRVTYHLGREVNDSIDIVFNVQERDFGRYSLGLRYDQTNQFLFGAEVAQENLFGSGAGAGLGITLGNPREGWVRYSGARFFGLPFNYRLQGFSSTTEHRYYPPNGQWAGASYQNREYGADLKLGLNIGGNSYFKAGLEARRIRLAPDTLTDVLFGRHEEQIIALSVEFKARTYSDLTFPQQGIAFQARARYGLRQLACRPDFFKSEAQLVTPVALGRRAVFEPKLFAGLALDDRLRAVPAESLPVAELFRAGGPELAGAAFEEFLTPQKLGLAVGFKFLLFHLFNSQDYPFYVELAGDVASFEPLLETKLSSSYYGAYAGLTQTTPFGPVKLGFGLGKDWRYNVYFAAGFDLLPDLPR
jgi:NTE family protein